MARSAANRASTAAGRRRASARGRSTHAPAKPRKPARPAKQRKSAPASKPRKRLAGSRRATARRAAPRPAREPRRKRRALRPRGGLTWRGRAIALAGLALVLASAYFLWFRDSSLVTVDDVEVVGVTSGDREAIAAELTRVATGMTTLHADVGRIEDAAKAFPTVKSVSVDMNFPHGARIEVIEHRPTSVVGAGEGRMPVAADGTLLPGVPLPEEKLPELPLGEPPSGDRLEGDALEQALVVGGAPAGLRPLIERIETTRDYGVEVTLRGGIPIRFGDSTDAAAKWTAAAAVLADPKLEALCNLDVRVPSRPAAGCAAKPVDEPATETLTQ